MSAKELLDEIIPATDGFAVTPNDSADLTRPTRALWVGGAGDVVVDMVDGTTLTIGGVQAGTLLPFAVKRVRATNTTATLIVGLF